MEIAAIVYLLLIFLLLTGTSKRVKIWFLSIYGAIVLVFIAGSLTIKSRTGYFKDRTRWMSHHGTVELGNWVVPFFLLFAIALLVLIDFRIIQKLRKLEKTGKWVIGIFTVIFNFIYLVCLYACIFFVILLFHPFGP